MPPPVDATKYSVVAKPPQETPPRQYEFDDLENAVFRGLAAKLARIAVLVITGVLVFAAYVGWVLIAGSPFTPELAFAILMALVLFAHALWFLDAGRAFGQVVETEGDDIPHLMDGLRKVNSFLTLSGVAAGFALLAGVVVGIVILVRHFNT